MKTKKNAIIVLLIFSMIILIVGIMLIFVDKDDNDIDLEELEKNTYNFGSTLELEQEPVYEEIFFETEEGIESFGALDGFDDGNEPYVKDGKLYVPDGNETTIVSHTWMDEGNSKYIKKPDFGKLEKVVVSESEFSCGFADVSSRDVSKYKKELTDAGFNKVIIDGNLRDIYVYSVKNEENITVTLNYIDNRLQIYVF